MIMKNTITIIIQKIINFFKSFFKKKNNLIQDNIIEDNFILDVPEESDQPEVKRLFYTKRTD